MAGGFFTGSKRASLTSGKVMPPFKGVPAEYVIPTQENLPFDEPEVNRVRTSVTRVKSLPPAIYHNLITEMTAMIFATYCHQGREFLQPTVFLQETFGIQRRVWASCVCFRPGRALGNTLVMCLPPTLEHELIKDKKGILFLYSRD